MKNKKIIVAIFIICAIIVGSFIQEKFFFKDQTNETKKLSIGVLQFVSHPALDEIYRGFTEELEKQGYQDQKNITIHYQNGQADQSKLVSMSQQLLQHKPDVLVGIATPAAQALANQTKEVPIVLGAVSDPKDAGLVKDNKKPGGNITGVSDSAPIDKQLALALELIPDVKTVGVLYSSSEANSKMQVEQAKREAKKLNLEIKPYAVPSSNEINQTVHALAKEVDFLLIPNDNTIASAMQTVVSVANQYKLPIVPPVATMVEQGGLATVGVNQYQLGVQTAKMAVNIMEHKKEPANYPIYHFTVGDNVINKKQADLLNIKIPEHLQKYQLKEKG